jgi:hypothetical protein
MSSPFCSNVTIQPFSPLKIHAPSQLRTLVLYHNPFSSKDKKTTQGYITTLPLHDRRADVAHLSRFDNVMQGFP